jgi:hypothetical protein
LLKVANWRVLVRPVIVDHPQAEVGLVLIHQEQLRLPAEAPPGTGEPSENRIEIGTVERAGEYVALRVLAAAPMGVGVRSAR